MTLKGRLPSRRCLLESLGGMTPFLAASAKRLEHCWLRCVFLPCGLRESDAHHVHVRFNSAAVVVRLRPSPNTSGHTSR
jgi:hypothetical protein